MTAVTCFCVVPVFFAKISFFFFFFFLLYEDNKAAILFADHPGDHRRSKHIDTRKYFVRDAVLNSNVQLVYVPTTKQIADGLTKPLSSTLHQTLCVNNLLVRYDMK